MNLYQRKLPHWQPANAEYFVTFRLAGSLPISAIEKIRTHKQLLDQELTEPNSSESYQGSDRLSDLHKRQKLLFKKYEGLLDNPTSGPTWLSKKAVAKLVCEAIHYRNSKEYDLYASCVMPNHVHIVFQMVNQSNKDDVPVVTNMLQSLKSYTALKANEILKRTGQFWQPESFDRVIRNQEELESTVRYV